MRKTKAERYLMWLRDQIAGGGENTKDYIFLLSRLANKEFYAVIDRDNNRAADGVYLRYTFCENFGCNYDELNEDLGPCRVLEMMVALAINGAMSISFEKTGIGASELFWIMVRNLGLMDFSDDKIAKYDDPVCEISDILHTFMDRKSVDRVLFCIKRYKKAVLELEIWAQFNEFVVENEYF